MKNILEKKQYVNELVPPLSNSYNIRKPYLFHLNIRI